MTVAAARTDHQDHPPHDAREYARVLEDPRRDAWPHDMMMALDCKLREVVADIGAGTGYSHGASRATPLKSAPWMNILFHKKPKPFGPPEAMRIFEDGIIREFQAAGFRKTKASTSCLINISRSFNANETLSETHLHELPQREEFSSRKGSPV